MEEQKGKPIGWLKGKPETEYRKSIYVEMVRAYSKYTVNKMTRDKKSEGDVNKEKVRLDKLNADTKAYKKVEVVSPKVPEVNKKKPCMKYGGMMCGAKRPRQFSYDQGKKKYIYWRTPEDQKDVETKAMDLARCTYEIQGKDMRPMEGRWDDESNKCSHRLSMNFEERKNGPIYYYSEDVEELHSLKNFGLLCVKQKHAESVKDKAGKPIDLKVKLEQLLALLSYSYGFRTWNRCVGLHNRITEKSMKAAFHMTDMAHGIEHLRDQYNASLKAWAKVAGALAKNTRPFSTLRIKAVLRSLCRNKEPNEKVIHEAVQKIIHTFREMKNENPNIVEHSGKGADDNPAYTIYKISEEIVPFLANPEMIPREHSAFCRFDYPKENINKDLLNIKVNHKDSKVMIETVEEPTSTVGELQFSDISSIVLDHDPQGTSDSRKKSWLRLNGRKIKKHLDIKDEIDEEGKDPKFIDPSNNFLAKSIDSYLTRKSLFELKFYVVKLQNIDSIIKKFGDEKLGFRIKIKVEDYFWTSTSFVLPKPTKKGVMLEFKQNFRVRVHPGISSFVRVSLWACKMEEGKLPDILKSLTREEPLGSTKINLKSVSPQKKVIWVPLNNGTCFDDPFANEGTPTLSMNFHLLNDMPGNYPEAPFSGKAYDIGEMVSLIDKADLKYPSSQLEFGLLNRTDINFDESRKEQKGCPLRFPANEEEWKVADLGGEFKPTGAALEGMIGFQNRIPFMYKMPKDRETFIENRLAGNYDELSKKYNPGDIVSELDYYEVKHVCVLKGITDDEYCWLLPCEALKNPNPGEPNKYNIKEVQPMCEDGISVFERKKNYPFQMTEKCIDHEWTLDLGFDNDVGRTKFLRAMKEALRDYWYKQRAGKSGEVMSKADISPPLTGELQVYVSEVKNLPIQDPALKTMSNKVQIRIGFRSPRSIADLFASAFVDETLLDNIESNFKKEDVVVEHLLKDNISWRTAEQPAGEMRSLGRLAKLPKSNALLTITVSVPYEENGVEKLYILGNAEVSVSQLLDEHYPTKYFWLLLKNDLESNLPQIKLWTMFYPEDREMKYLVHGDPVKSFANQLLARAEHGTEVVDTYKQPVNLGIYNPNYMRPEQDMVAALAECRGLPEDEKIICQIVLSKFDYKKSSFEAWEYELVNAYRYLNNQAKATIFDNMDRYLWDTYLTKLMANVTKMKTRTLYAAKEAERIEANMDNQLQKARGSLLKLDRLEFWKNAGSWKYADIVALCKLGIPKELRPYIWSELLRVYDSKDPNFEEEKVNKFNHYVEKSRSFDSMVYRQMEHDILDIKLTNVCSPSDEILQHNERAGVLKLAKAFYAWCLDENEKLFKDSNLDNAPEEKRAEMPRYGYFKGVLHLIQKIWQVLEQVDAFWCIISFAKALPYIFQMQDVSVGSISWSEKLLLLAISTVVEIKYPELYKAILRHGLPIEYYLGDKMFTLLSTVFPTETLMRFLDIIALEYASKEPVRAIWIVMTACILLLTLNEKYIKVARSVAEIELIINNTGINRLQSQKIIEQIYSLSNELFTTYNPRWELILATWVGKQDSVMGMEQAWTKKAYQLEDRYKNVKELNIKVNELLASIRTLGQEEVKGEEKAAANNDEIWASNFVRRFCTYYGEHASKEVPDRVSLYISRCRNVVLEGSEIKVANGGSLDEAVNVSKDGIVDRMIEFTGDAQFSVIKIEVPGGVGSWCEIKLTDYQTDMPITVDLPLLPVPGFGGEVQHRGKQPLPFISVVLLITSKIEGHVDDTYKYIKQGLAHESTIIQPATRQAMKKQEFETVALTKKNLTKQFHDAGLSSIYTPGIKEMGGETGDAAANDKQALRHLFALIKSESASKYGGDLAGNLPENEELVTKTYNLFTSFYNGKLPLKRIIVSLLAAASITVDEKLSLYFDLYTSMLGAGNHSFLLEDMIELIQLLYELHLIFIPPEYIPHLVEQVMTDGGINRITNAYLISADSSVPEVLKEMHWKGPSNNERIVVVTQKVQEAFSRDWEIWGSKQIFAGDPSSFCGKLDRVLGGYRVRPKNKGPYKLLICYKHGGHEFFKEFQYTEKEDLVLPSTPSSDRRGLLSANSNNLSFVGEKINITKEQFIERVKKLPLLSELMRIQVSQRAPLMPKAKKELSVIVLHNKKAVVKVDFYPIVERDDFETPEGPTSTPDIKSEKPRYTYNKSMGRYEMQLQSLYKEDLLAEAKSRILEAINVMISEILMVDPSAEIPEALKPDIYLNHSLQFYEKDVALDDYKRVNEIRDNEITLSVRESDAHMVKPENRKSFALHMHGDYAAEWVKCVDVKKREAEYLIKTVLFPNEAQVAQRNFLLLDKKDL